MSIKVLPFLDVFEDESGGNVKTPQSEYLSAGKFPVVDQGKALIAGYVDDESRLCGNGRPAIVFGDHTRCVKYVGFPFCMGADGVKVLRPKIEADLKYLYYFLKQLEIPNAGYDRHYKYLKRTEVVLQALPEQRRIVAILDQADALRAKRREALAQLDSLSQSIFIEMFGDPVANSRGWRVLSLAKLGKVSTGRTPPGSMKGMFGGPIPFVTPGDLGSNAPVNRTLTAEGVAEVSTVRAGATLVCCIGTVGKMDKITTRSAFNQQINAVEWFDEIDDDFGHLALGFYKSQMASRATSTTVPILNKSAFEKLEIPVPPRELQQEFSNRLAAVTAIKRVQQAAHLELDTLFASLQYLAFRGEL